MKECPKSSTTNKLKSVEPIEKVYNLRKVPCDEDDVRKIESNKKSSKSDIKTQFKDDAKVSSTEIRTRRKRREQIETNDACPTKVLRSGTKITQMIPSQKTSAIKTEHNNSEAVTVDTLSPSCSTSQTIPSCSSTKQYSDLKYLESIGSIRTIRKIKHPGINKVPTSKITNISTPFVSPESQNGWDRKTKLKLSYRLGSLGSNDIQFALIVYEPLAMVSRRNLLEEFERAATEEGVARASKNNSEPVKTFVSPKVASGKVMKSSKMKNDKLISLRRLRF